MSSGDWVRFGSALQHLGEGNGIASRGLLCYPTERRHGDEQYRQDVDRNIISTGYRYINFCYSRYDYIYFVSGGGVFDTGVVGGDDH